MPNKSEDRKENEPSFKEIAKGKLYNVRFPGKNVTWIDLRSEAQKKVGVSAKDLGVEYGKGEKFDQLVFVSDEYFRNATPYEVWKETEKIKRIVTNLSGSANVAVISSRFVPSDMPKCKKCGTPLFIVGEGFNCQKCGESTV